MCGGNSKETYLEIFYFKQFYKHFVFAEDEEGNRKKRLEKYFEVSAVVDVGGGWGYKRKIKAFRNQRVYVVYTLIIKSTI